MAATLLRERIASLYPNASAANVLVTVGAAQANWMVCGTLLEAGDEVIVVSPGYRQVWGMAKNAGCRVKETHLRPENNWRLNLDELESLAGPKTKLISIVNPNNPTGSILSREEMARIVSICQKTGAWLHADEVYRGTELAGDETPSFWGMYERVICVNSMSKAYGLAGLRIGWAVASPEMVEELWRRHEYAVIAAVRAKHEAGGDRAATSEAEDAARPPEKAFARRPRGAGKLGARARRPVQREPGGCNFDCIRRLQL